MLQINPVLTRRRGRITNKETDQKSGPHCSYFLDPSAPVAAAGWTRPTPTGGGGRGTGAEPDQNPTIKPIIHSGDADPASLPVLCAAYFALAIPPPFLLQNLQGPPGSSTASRVETLLGELIRSPVIPVVRDPNELPTELSSSHETFNTCKTIYELRRGSLESAGSLQHTLPQNVSHNIISLKNKEKLNYLQEVLILKEF